MGQPAHQPIPQTLHALNQRNQHDNHSQHHLGQKPLIPVANAKIAQSAAAGWVVKALV